MKRLLLALGLCASLAVVGAAIAQEGHSEKANAKMDAKMAKDAPMTVSGEIVDLGCYLGHGAKGAEHASCATKCIAGGMPMGLLTNDNKLYLMTMSHADAGPFNKAKEMAAKMVTVTGPVHERDGMLSIEVDSLAPAKADADAGK